MNRSSAPTREDPCEAELRRLRKINRVLMDRVERDMDAQGGNAYTLFRTAITLEAQVSERTAELNRITHQLRSEIAQRRLTEKALQAAKAEAEQANFGKTRFLAAATHDLSQPMNAARLFLGAIADELTTPRSRDLLARIDVALDTVDDLLGALLEISKLDAGGWPITLVDVAVGPMLARLAEEYRPQAEAAGLELRVVDSRAIIRTDRHLFERVLRNLLSNAIRYTAEGRILLGCRRGGGRLRVQVWDSGIGIAEADREAIFGEFKRVSPSPRQDANGLGLGLAIVDRVARLLDLGIDVASEVGRGSCFSVSVVMSPAGSAEQPPEVQAAALSALVGQQLLIIDNDASERIALRELLLGWGCGVVEAGSGAEAVLRLGDAQSGPDLMIADYHLDAAASGVEAIRYVRERLSRALPALLISGDRSPGPREAARTAGLALMAKPLNPARLRAMLSYLARPPTREGAETGLASV